MNYFPSKFGSRSKGTKEKQTIIFDEKFWSQFKGQIKKNDKARDGAEKKQSGSKAMLLKSLFDKSTTLYPSQISASLLSEYSNKDITKAYELIRYFNLCDAGHLVTINSMDKFNKKIKLAGAENWGNVMCYLDSLLFSMFAKLESFEPLLMSLDNKSNDNIDNYTNNGENNDEGNSKDAKIQQLKAILRVYVSLLRSGKLITYDITRLLCESLCENGFEEALSRKQEDSCQLFIFLTELLSMPLLTLKIDIAHGGKEAAKDDHRFAKERMLYVSIPSEDDEINRKPALPSVPKIEEEHFEPKNSNGPQESNNEKIPQQVATDNEEAILLEECLEHYFNNSIQVKRQLERRLSIRRNTVSHLESLQEGLSLHAHHNDDIDKPQNQHVEVTEDSDSQFEDDAKTSTITEGAVSNTVCGSENDDKKEYDKVDDFEESQGTGSSEPSVIDEDEYKDAERGELTYIEDSDTNKVFSYNNSNSNPASPRSKSQRSATMSLSNSDKKRSSRRYSISKDSSYNINVTPRSRASSSVSIFSDNKVGEVSLPAWMFLQLLPFYTDLEPKSQTEQSFAEKRPILPICLKRYTFGKNSKKNNKRVIIPSFIDLPDFIADDSSKYPPDGSTEDTDNGDQLPTNKLYGRFRLVLESVVCHRGGSIDSGHFVSLVRDELFDINATEEEEDAKRWLLFDDLNEKQRVRPITFKKAVSTEIPYILFYRMETFTEPLKRQEREKELYNQAAEKAKELILNNKNNNNNIPKANDDLKSDEALDEKFTALRLYNYNKNQPAQAPPQSSHSVDTNDGSITKSTLNNQDASGNERKKSEASATVSEKSNTSGHTETDPNAPTKKSHDYFSKMVFANSTYPYPNSSDYVDIKDKFYWKYKTEDGSYFEEVPTPNILVKNIDIISNSSLSSKMRSKRNSSILSDNFSNKSLYSDDESLEISNNNISNSKENILALNNSNNTEDLLKSGRLYRMNSSVGSLWSKRKRNSKKKSKSDLSDSVIVDGGKLKISLTTSKEDKGNGSEVNSEVTPIGGDPFKPLIFEDENGYLNTSGSAIQSPRSSYEVTGSRDRILALNETEKEKLKRSKYVSNGKVGSKHKHKSGRKKNDIKVKREKYKDEKCIIM